MNEAISLDEAKLAILRSGYLMESRLYSVLRARNADWQPSTNTAYPDPETGKSRELDVRAVWIPQEGHSSIAAAVEFVIECVNNPQPMAFFVLPRDSAPIGSRTRIAGSPLRIVCAKSRPQHISTVIGLSGFHHYGQGKIARQFCSFSMKKHSQGKKATEWMASHDDSHFGCFDTLSKAADFYTEEYYRTAVRQLDFPNFLFLYPVLVTGGPLITVVEREDSDLSLEYVCRVQYIHSEFRRNEHVLQTIDVVREDYFDQFLDDIEQEHVQVMSHLTGLRDNIRKAFALYEDLKAKHDATESLRSAFEAYIPPVPPDSLHKPSSGQLW